MSHQIEELDLTFSNSGTEWHGLAVVEPDNKKLIKLVRENLFFPIIECDATVSIEGESIKLKDPETGKGWKVVMADCRALPVHPARREHPAAFVPLHIPKTSYNPFENEGFFEALEKACERLGIPFILSTAGTLANLGQFYFSLEIQGLSLKGAHGEVLKPYLSGVTSHTGLYLPTYRDTVTRPVCANTVSALMHELSNLNIVGKHTKNGLAEISNMGEAVEAFFTGAKRLETEVFPQLQDRELDSIAMRETVAGYFLLPALDGERKIDVDKLKMSKQAQNAIEGIVDLARTGKGNNGRTAYDLWNGATDYWSNGDGVGKQDTVGLSKRAFRSNFGSASKHKQDFSGYLFDAKKSEAGRKLGKRVLKNQMMIGG